MVGAREALGRKAQAKRTHATDRGWLEKFGDEDSPDREENRKHDEDVQQRREKIVEDPHRSISSDDEQLSTHQECAQKKSGEQENQENAGDAPETLFPLLRECQKSPDGEWQQKGADKSKLLRLCELHQRRLSAIGFVHLRPNHTTITVAATDRAYLRVASVAR